MSILIKKTRKVFIKYCSKIGRKSILETNGIGKPTLKKLLGIITIIIEIQINTQDNIGAMNQLFRFMTPCLIINAGLMEREVLKTKLIVC